MNRPTVLLIIFLGVLFPLTFFGQTSVQGVVTDAAGQPIIGANVYLENTYDGASTLADGTFGFSTEEQGHQVLIGTYLGYAEARQPVQIGEEPLDIRITLKENALELQKVVITAGAYEAGGVNKSEILKPLDILTTAGATGDIAGALNTLPGTQTVGESGRLFVRGGEGYETKTFIDGLQVMNFYSAAAPNTPGRSRFMPYMFSGTSFSTGGYSAEYGQALSSALILNSKFKAQQDRTDISLMTVGADVGTTQTWEKGSLSAKAQYTNLDPYIALIDQEIEWIDAPTSLDGSVAYRQQISSSGILKVFGNFNRSDFQLNQQEIGDPAIKTPTKLSNRYTYLNAMVQELTGKDWEVKGGISYTRNRNEIQPDQDELLENESGIHTKLTLGKALSSQMKIKMGGEFFYRHFVQDYLQAGENFSQRFQFTEQLAGLFVESDLYLTPTLLARVGVRSEYTGLNNNLNLAPRLSLGLKTSEHSQLSAAFGRFQQTPQNQWLMIVDQLEQEKADHYILNYQISGQNRTFRVEGYYKQYRDLVKFRHGEQFSVAAYSNSGTGFARGFDLFWRDSQSLRNVDYWISYSYLDTERNYQDFPTAVTPSFASRHNLSVVYKHFLSDIKSQIGLTYTYASGRPYHDPNEAGFMNSRTPAYMDLSGNLSYLMRQNIIVHLSATNLLGRNHIFGYEYASLADQNGRFPGRAIRPAARRFLFLGVFITFSREAVLNQLPNL
jgi:hypothetical protein